MESTSITEMCISHMESRKAKAQNIHRVLTNKKEENLVEVRNRFNDLKQCVEVCENRLMDEIQSAYDVELNRCVTCMTRISRQISQARETNKIDTSEIEIPDLRNTQYVVNLSPVKLAIQQLKLAEEMFHQPRLHENTIPGGSSSQHSSVQSTSNQINVNVTFATQTPSKKSKASTASMPSTASTAPTASTASTASTINTATFAEKESSSAKKRKVAKRSSIEDHSKHVVGAVEAATSGDPVEDERKEQQGRVRDVVRCIKCNRTRCVYSVNKLTEEERPVWEEFSRTLTSFICGFDLFPKVHLLRKVMWVEKDLQSCEAEINPHYYGVRSTKKWPPLCYKCGAIESLEAISSEDLEKYASIDPVCKQCIFGKNVPGPRRRRKKAKSTVHGTNKDGGEPSIDSDEHVSIQHPD